MTSKTIHHASEIKQKLLQEIQKDAKAGRDRLAPEAEMAERLNASRTLIRDCLSSLEQDGFISRVHGVGTIINRHVAASEHRIDLEKEFIPTLRDGGLEGELLSLKVSVIDADAETAAGLRVHEGTKLVSAVRIIGAGGEPCIRCQDMFSLSLCKKPERVKEELTGSVFDYLSEKCGIEMQTSIAQLDAVRCDKALAGEIGMQEGDVILRTTETGFDLFGRPRMYSKAFYRPGFMKHMVVRKKIG